MNLIIYGLYNSYHFPMIEALHEEFEIDYCEIIGNAESNATQASFSEGYTFHDWHAISGGYSGLDWNLIDPLDQNLIESMRECEVEVYRMMDRKSRNILDAWPYEFRRKIYYEHLRYWNHVLTKRDFDAFVALNIPHEVLDFIIFHLCKVRGISTFFFYQFQYDMTFLMSDWREPLPGYCEIEKKLRDKWEKGGSVELELSERLSEEVHFQTDENGQHIPFYMRKKKKTLGKRLLSGFTEFALFLTGLYKDLRYLVKLMDIHSLRQVVRKNNFRKAVSRLEKDSLIALQGLHYIPNKEDRYIYFPLHLQPELSTSPLAGRFADQNLILEMLSYYLPEDVLIYVKEHPNQDFSRRGRDFYKRLSEIRSVRMIPKEFSSKELLSNCIAVATASGTVGWEAIFKNKPVLLFGNTFYQYAPGIYQIRNSIDCKFAIAEIISRKHTTSEFDRTVFLKLVDLFSIKGNVDIEYRIASKLDFSRDIEALSAALIRVMREKIKGVGPEGV
ncbi:capsule biosynthesis protein [Leptospira fletcheri]|uniref:Capsule biosynthesis protein n=1 Tax=Leptospira fletcheri TaxID=2484981 RepID=A0A4R9GDY0_9LEPT|nr:capsule biosynthesis protein [Leptospira fletcheri]TGK09951.1 capsule biosynthesis protein [Leptospira fletcheri]